MTKRIALVLLLAAVTAPCWAPAQTVNCLVAVVNGEVITLLDVQVATEFGLGRAAAVEPGTDSRLAVLDALIERKIVLDLAREARGADRSEIVAAIAELRRALGEEAFAGKLAKFGLLAEDLGPYLEERILFNRALSLRFSQSVPVSLTEIERTYRDIYIPEQNRLGLAVEPLERVSAAIEARIRGVRRTQQMDEWVRDLRTRADVQLKKDCLK
jgi:hypothetical protein